MSSCSMSDDNGGGGVTPAAPDTTPVSVKVTYGAKIEADMLANADVEIEYLDASGNKKTNIHFVFHSTCNIFVRLNLKTSYYG